MRNYTEIKELISLELKHANREHALFHSSHEGYAIIKEELEETTEALERVKRQLDNLWVLTRVNDELNSIVVVDKMEMDLLDVISEAVQTAAMCKKYKQSLLGE